MAPPGQADWGRRGKRLRGQRSGGTWLRSCNTDPSGQGQSQRAGPAVPGALAGRDLRNIRLSDTCWPRAYPRRPRSVLAKTLSRGDPRMPAEPGGQQATHAPNSIVSPCVPPSPQNLVVASGTEARVRQLFSNLPRLAGCPPELAPQHPCPEDLNFSQKHQQNDEAGGLHACLALQKEVSAHTNSVYSSHRPDTTFSGLVTMIQQVVTK